MYAYRIDQLKVFAYEIALKLHYMSTIRAAAQCAHHHSLSYIDKIILQTDYYAVTPAETSLYAKLYLLLFTNMSTN